MTHSESQFVCGLREFSHPEFSDLVKESSARPRVISTNGITKVNGENGVKNIGPRPPLPPKMSKLPPKPPRSTPNSTSNDLSSTPQILSSATKLPLKLSLPRSRTPTNIDYNNNSNFLSLSRNSSLQSIDSFNSFRSTSPSLSQCSNSSLNSRRSMRSRTPRRIFPQAYKPSKTIDLSELQSLDYLII